MTVVAVNGGAMGSGMVAFLRDALAKAGMDEVVVVDTGSPAAGDAGGVGAGAGGADVVLTLEVDRASLARAITPSVRWVHAFAAGVDGFPFDLLDGRTMTCSRGATAPAIAEFVLATMLAFEKDLPATWVTEPPEQWNIANLGGLANKVLGLIGLGAIGSEVARRAAGFEMELVALRRTATPGPLPGVHIASSLDEVLRVADHVVVAAPLTARTHRLLDAAAFSAMKRGAHLVNVSRGGLIDQEALRRALDDGIVAMASLDVTDPEPLPPGHWLYSHPRARVSPHVSWSAPGTVHRTIGIFVDNLTRYRAGQPLGGLVDPVAGY